MDASPHTYRYVYSNVTRAGTHSTGLHPPCPFREVECFIEYYAQLTQIYPSSNLSSPSAAEHASTKQCYDNQKISN